MRPRTVVMWFGLRQSGASLSFLLAAVGGVPGLVIKVLLMKLVVLMALAVCLVPLLVWIGKDAAVIAKIELAAVALSNGLGRSVHVSASWGWHERRVNLLS